MASTASRGFGKTVFGAGYLVDKVNAEGKIEQDFAGI